MQIKFYVPRRFEAYKAVGAVLEDIVQLTGGMTFYDANGCFTADGEKQYEPVSVFEVYMVDDRPNESWNNRKAFLARSLETLSNILGAAGEKSFLYTVDNEPTFVDLSKVATITL